MKNIQEDIKSGNFKSAYLLCGEEAYLKVQYKNKLLKALNPDDDTMNFNHYEGRNIDVKELIDLCETMPFFADRRVVLLEDTGFFKNKCDELADYMKELPDYLCLVFVEDEVDKRSKMYKAVKSCGRIGEFARQDEKTLMQWAAGILKREGKNITQRDMELLLTMTGIDMGNLRMELEKLITYTGDRNVVTRADIQEVCTTQTQNKIFDMVRAVTEKNQKRALDLYYDLLTLKEPPMRILFLLAKQFRQLLLVKEYTEEGVAQPEMASRLGGIPGMLMCVLGAIIPPMVILSLISVFYDAFRSNYYIAALLKGMSAGVGAVIISVVYDMGKNVVKSKDWINIVIMIASFCVSYFLNVNIIFIILGVAAFGFVRTLLKEGKKR